PMLMDYIEQHSIDPEVIISKFGNYYCFLKKYN
ncbi:ATP-dependent helicase, partial [Staphylococcus devriesei]